MRWSVRFFNENKIYTHSISELEISVSESLKISDFDNLMKRLMPLLISPVKKSERRKILLVIGCSRIYRKTGQILMIYVILWWSDILFLINDFLKFKPKKAIRVQIKMKKHLTGHFKQFYSHQIIAYQILARIGLPKSVIKLNLFVRKTIQI